MATDPGTIAFLIDQLHDARYTTRRMFGEYCLYRDGVPIALVCDDALYVKDTAHGRAAIAPVAGLEFAPPYPGAKLHLRLAPDRWDDADWLGHVLECTAAALPPPKPELSKPRPAKSASRARPKR
jgi:DNA transformation protein